MQVDYFLYSYSVSAKKWGEEANRAGICYMADLAVLDLADLKPSEVDYLVSQALSVGAADFEAVAQIKLEVRATLVCTLAATLLHMSCRSSWHSLINLARRAARANVCPFAHAVVQDDDLQRHR